MAIINIPEFENIKITKACHKELEKIIDGFGNKRHFEKWLYDRFTQLNTIGFAFEDYPRLFEPIEEFYAITFRNSQKNIRILYHVEKNFSISFICFVGGFIYWV